MRTRMVPVPILPTIRTAISPKARLGFTAGTLYQHQSTLRLMAEGLGLRTLPGAATAASNMAEFFTP